MSREAPAPEDEGKGLAVRLLRSLLQAVVVVVGIVVLAAVSGVLVLSQTATGRGAASALLEDALNDAVRGRVQVGPVTGGNLVTRSIVDRFTISDEQGRTFLDLRDVRVSYSPFGLVTGRIHLRRMSAEALQLSLLQDADGSWNFERIFAGDEEDDGDEGEGLRLLVTDLRVAGGGLEVRMPWTPDVGGAAGDSLRSAALRGEDIWRYERADGGVEQVISLDGLSGSVPFLRLVDPARDMRIELEEVGGRLEAVSQSLALERLDATAILGDSVHVALDRVEVGRSRLEGPGWVIPGDPPRFRFDLEADRLDFGDLRWLPVPVPESGGGPALLGLRTVGDGEVTVVDVRESRIRSGDSRADGGFTLFLEESPRLQDVDLELHPLRLALVNRLLEQPEAPDGWVEGEVGGSGPLDLFRVDARVRIRRLSADTLPEAGEGPVGREPSLLTARGGVGLVGEPREMADLRLDLEDFEPRWTRLIGMDTRQRGRISGTATLDRTPARRIAFSADLRRRAPGDSASHLRASGTFAPGDQANIELEATADPLSLSVLDPYFPNLRLVGAVRGPASASGTLADLRARADLQTPRGQVRFDGQFDLAAERKRYDATVEARDLQLRQWLEGGPVTELAVRGRVDGVGTDPADLQATFDLEVLPSSFEGARVDSSLLRFTVQEGLARVDTFAIQTDVGTLRGRGGFGLDESSSASLYLTVDAPDLSTWNRWIVPGRNPARPDTTAQDLFALFPEPPQAGDGGRQARTAPPDTLAGSLAARGAVYGNPYSLGFGGSLAAGPVSYGESAADSVRLTLDAGDVRALDSLVVRGGAWGLSHGVQRVDSADFRIERRGADVSDVRLRATRGDRAGLRAGGTLTWTEARRAAELDELEVRLGDRRLRLENGAAVAYGEDGLSVRGLSLAAEEGARISAEGEIPDQGDASFDMEMEAIDLAALAELLAVGEGVRGRLGGSLSVRGTSGAPRMEASLAVDSVGFGDRAYRRLRVRAGYSDRELDGTIALLGEDREMVRLEGGVRTDLAFRDVERRLLGDPLDLTLRADSLPLDLVTLPLGTVREVEGHGVGTVRILGSPDDPDLDGRIALREGRALVVPLNVRYRDIRGSIGFRGSEARVDSLSAASAAGGRAEVTGTIGLESFTVPTFDLDLRARELAAIQRHRISLTVDGEGRLEGDLRSPDVEGSFRLSNGTLRTETFTRREDVVDLTDPELIGLLDTATVSEERLLDRVQNPFLQNLRARLDLRIGPDTWLRSPDLQVEVAGDLELQLDRAREDVVVFGDVELVRGTYRWTWGPRGAFSRQLRITEGRIEFVGTPGLNPNLDIVAAHRTRTDRGALTVEVRVTGTMLAPSLALTSDPPLPESDQVCVLLMNAPCAAPGAGQLARDQLLGRVGSELSTALAAEVGIDYLEVRSTGRRNGAGTDGTGTEGTLFSDAEVEAGWYLSPEVFLTVTYPLGGRLPGARLDWRFTDVWSLELLSELRFDDALGRGGDSNLGRERRWGLFLFRDWTF